MTNKRLREKDIERYLVEQVRAAGGIAYKFTSPARRNVPDRLCLFQSPITMFIECKAPGQKPSAGQLREIKRLEDLGYVVLVIDGKEQVDELIKRVKAANRTVNAGV